MSEEFLKIIDFLKNEDISRIGIFTHLNADPDSVSSAIGLQDIIQQYIPKSTILLFASSLSLLSKKILPKSKNDGFKNKLPEDLEAIFLCDTNNLSQLGDFNLDEYINKKTPIFIIDHHSSHDFSKQVKATIINDSTSTAEIIAQIYKDLKLSISTEISTLLLAGILFDTRRFRYLSPRTLIITQFLINEGGKYEEAGNLLQSTLSISEKVARLKGASRIQIHKEESNIYTISHISSFESSVARALIDLGASCSIVVATTPDEEHRISLRCTKNFAEEKQINLGDVANQVATKLGGSGGGHETAAGLNISKTDIIPKETKEKMKYLLKLFIGEIEAQ